jgi:diadenosine tetraphosphatase ApaH/serine/threonine PP2A family protein phosphatase
VRIAVLSDIHGNLHALDAALSEIDAAKVDQLWCLGDLVGYGPRPNECIDRIHERASLSLCGNHDLAVLGLLDMAEFSGDAAAAAIWTQGVLGEPQRTWLSGLEPAGRSDGAELFHGSPRDPIWDYVLSEGTARESLDETSEPLVLVGHSHVALALSLTGETLAGGLAPAGTTAELTGRRWLLNPGSIGQPRDGDARAAWLLVDTEASRAEFRRVEYPIEKTQTEIRELGLPAALAARLTHGI